MEKLFNILLVTSVFLVLYTSSLNAQNHQSEIILDSYGIIQFDDIFLESKKSLQGRSQVDLGEFGVFDLELQETILFDPQYQLRYKDEDGTTILNNTKPKTYIGSVAKMPGSLVALTIAEDFIHGIIRTTEGEINIEPLRYYDSTASKTDVVTYLTEDQSHDQSMMCGMDKKLEAQFIKQIDQATETKSAANGCIEVDMAIASDFLMFQSYGSAEEVELHAITILNLAQTNYDTEFVDEIRFNLVEQFVSTCESCDPWTSSVDSETLLLDFREWSETGWTNTVDQVSLWTKRDITREGNTAANGLAWVNTVCSEYAAMVVEDNDSETDQRKRVLFAHELGHNFGAVHDPDNTGFIMSTPLIQTNEWSSTSRETINRRYLRFLCLSACDRSENVIADFDVEFIGQCAPITVQYRNRSIGEIDSVQWLFPGGTPAVSSELEPSVVYNVGGEFNTQLTIYGTNGTTDIIEKRAIVSFSQIPASDFDYVLMEGNVVSFTINNPSDNTDYLWDFGDGFTSSSTAVTHQFVNSENVSVTLTASNVCGSSFTTNPIQFDMEPPIANFVSTENFVCTDEPLQFINLSENAESLEWFFEDGSPSFSTEENPVVSFSNPGSYFVGLIAINDFARDTILVPDYIVADPNPVSDFILEQDDKTVNLTFNSQFARVLLWDFGDGTTSEEVNPTHTYSDSGTYSISLTVENFCSVDVEVKEITIAADLPIAGFTQTSDVLCAGNSVLYTNNSSNATSFQWEFEGGLPSRSTSVNPVVIYPNPGVYDVTLTALNEDGETTTVKEETLEVIELPTVDFTISQTDNTVELSSFVSSGLSLSWEFGDGNTSTDANPSYTYTTDGQFVITLSGSNQCGTESIQKAIIIEADAVTDTIPNSAPEELQASISVSSRTLCAGSIATFDDLTENAEERTWLFEGGIPNQSTEKNPSVLYVQGGSFEVSLVTRNATSVDTLILPEHITIVNAPNANFNVVVADSTASFTNNSTSFNDLIWTFGDDQSSTESNPVHVYNEAGTYTVNLQVNSSCGADAFTQTITIEETAFAPSVEDLANTVDFSINRESVCLGQAFVVDNLTPDYDDAIWIIDGTDTLATDTIIIADSGLHEISLVVTIDTLQFTESKEVTVIGTPIVDFGYERTAFGNQVAFTNRTQNATRYFWTFEGNFSSIFENPTHIFSTEGQQTVSLLASNSCSSAIEIRSFDLSVFEEPQAIIDVSNTSICEGETVSFESLDTLTSEVRWFLEGASNEEGDNQFFSSEYANAGTYDVTLIATNINGSDTLTLENHISVAENPEIEIFADTNGNTVSFSATPVDGASYFWDFGDGAAATGSSVTHSYTTNDTFQVNMVFESFCGVQVVQTEVVIGAIEIEEADPVLPEASFIQTNTFVNVGGRILFSSTSTFTTNVEWVFSGAEPSTSTSENIIIQYDAPGTFDVTLIAHNEFGSDTLVQEEFIVVEELRLNLNETESRSLDSEQVNADFTMQAFPNPFIDQLALAFESPEQQQAELNVYSINGVSILQKEISLDQGSNLISIETANFPSGTYILTLLLREEVLQQKIIKR